MTERLQDITDQISHTVQLDGIVNSMRALAALRVRQAREALPATEAYAATVREALLRVLPLLPGEAARSQHEKNGGVGIILFCAEQGFAGLFSEHILEAVKDNEKENIFLVGARGATIARSRGFSPVWSASAIQQPAGMSDLADQITNEIFHQVITGKLFSIIAIFCHWKSGQGAVVMRKSLFPLDPALFETSPSRLPPILNLSPQKLLEDLTADYLFSQLCQIILHSFAAENEARSERMTAAHQEIERRLSDLEQKRRTIRQEGITSEIIELVSGPTLARLKKFSEQDEKGDDNYNHSKNQRLTKNKVLPQASLLSAGIELHPSHGRRSINDLT